MTILALLAMANRIVLPNALVDDFNRANGALSAPWVQLQGGLSISTNQVTGTPTQDSLYYYDSPVANDQFSEVTYRSSVAGTSWVGAACRLSTSAASGYMVCTDGSPFGGGNAIYRVLNGVYTNLIVLNTPFADGDVLRIAAIGTSIRAYKNGTQIQSITDTNYAAGRLGMYMYDAALQDNWVGGAA